NPDHDEVKELIDASNQFYTDLYPPESNHLTTDDELRQPDMLFIGGRLDQQLVASGAARMMNDDDEYAEIKRVYVMPGYRGQGLSLTIMDWLEQELRNRDIHLLRLETGVKQPEAIGLYHKLGYRERGPFGAYKPDPLSVFMEKDMRFNRPGEFS
ncbi:MAG: GNAT family N-acetyltransferase, partial [Pseudomonadota bacterium]